MIIAHTTCFKYISQNNTFIVKSLIIIQSWLLYYRYRYLRSHIIYDLSEHYKHNLRYLKSLFLIVHFIKLDDFITRCIIYMINGYKSHLKKLAQNVRVIF